MADTAAIAARIVRLIIEFMVVALSCSAILAIFAAALTLRI